MAWAGENLQGRSDLTPGLWRSHVHQIFSSDCLVLCVRRDPWPTTLSPAPAPTPAQASSSFSSSFPPASEDRSIVDTMTSLCLLLALGIACHNVVAGKRQTSCVLIFSVAKLPCVRVHCRQLLELKAPLRDIKASFSAELPTTKPGARLDVSTRFFGSMSCPLNRL